MNERYSPINNVGRGIFLLEISKLGWIPREFLTTDVGIDYSIEEVINGNPTAKFISVQLKTGLGNVSINRDGDYDFYVDKHHYEYWLGSSIPVIIVLCIPDRNELVWALIKRANIKKTRSQHKITIPKSHFLNSESISELSEIIRLYQSPFEVDGDIDDMKNPDYIENLFAECNDNIREMTNDFYALSNKYTSETSKLEEFYSHRERWSKENAEKVCRNFAKNMSLNLNISRCKIKQKAEVIFATYIGAIRSIDYILTLPDWFTSDAAALVMICLKDNVEGLKKHAIFMEEGVNKFLNGSPNDSSLSRSTHDYATTIKDYIALIRDMSIWASTTIKKFTERYRFSPQVLADTQAYYINNCKN